MFNMGSYACLIYLLIPESYLSGSPEWVASIIAVSRESPIPLAEKYVMIS